MAKMELISAAFLEQVYENGLWWNPRKGETLEEVLGTEKERDGPPRMLDLGESLSSLFPISSSLVSVADSYLRFMRATGSGLTAAWAISMADRFPAVECIGVGEEQES